jgi:hypothetical protein
MMGLSSLLKMRKALTCMFTSDKENGKACVIKYFGVAEK